MDGPPPSPFFKVAGTGGARETISVVYFAGPQTLDPRSSTLIWGGGGVSSRVEIQSSTNHFRKHVFCQIAVYFADTGLPNHTRLSTPSLAASHVEFLNCEHVATKSTCRLATNNLQTKTFVSKLACPIYRFFKNYHVP